MGEGVSHIFPILFYVGSWDLGAGVVMGRRASGDGMATVGWVVRGMVVW